MNILRKYLKSLIEKSCSENFKNILGLLEKNPSARILDLGCDDGSWSVKLAERVGTKNVYGVDLVDERLKIARSRGINVFRGDLNRTLPFEDSFFDVVHANQIIEHLSNTDLFIEEIYRVLKANGYAIISTENLASWHNVFSLVLGFQPFSMTNLSKKGNIGNPFSLWKGSNSPKSDLASWQHQRVFSYFGLKDFFEKYGFKVEKTLTSGFYPLPGFFVKLDKIHGHWITLKLKKVL